jgi:hypothetical protein
MNRRAVTLIVILIALLTACDIRHGPPVVPHDGWTPSATATVAPTSAAPTSTAPPPAVLVVPYSSPPRVTGTWPAGSVCRAHGALPDPACTPGSVAPVAQGAVCVTGFEATERPSSTDAAKTRAMDSYGISADDRPRVELDHLVPLSLGGSNDVTNLWPEVSDLPDAGFRNSKDAVERKLLAAVCKGGHVPLSEAQNAIAHDWTTALHVVGLT